jgi:antitoxin YefM
MCIGASEGASSSAALRRAAPPHRPLRPRGRVTYEPYVMCKIRNHSSDTRGLPIFRRNAYSVHCSSLPLTFPYAYNILYFKGVSNMDAVSYSDLRQNLKSYLDKVYVNNDPIIITRKKNENLVLLSMAEYNSLIETNYLMANEANAKHLLKSIRQARTGRVRKHQLIEK